MISYFKDKFQQFKGVLNSVSKRLEPVFKTFHEMAASLKGAGGANYKFLQAMLKLSKTTASLLTSVAKVLGNTGKALVVDLPRAAFSKYQEDAKQTAQSLQDSVDDFSNAGHHACKAANQTVEMASDTLELAKSGVEAGSENLKAACAVGSFALEVGSAACDGTKVVASNLYEIGAKAYAYTPSFEEVKHSISHVLSLPVESKSIKPAM